MDEAHNTHPNLNDQQQFRLTRINEIMKIILLQRLKKEN